MGDLDEQMKVIERRIERLNTSTELQLAYIVLLKASVNMYEALIYHWADSEEVDAAHTALGEAIDEALKAKRE